jgi:hypothetical protein
MSIYKSCTGTNGGETSFTVRTTLAFPFLCSSDHASLPSDKQIQAPVGDGPCSQPDTFLPKAHTCFFSINLPRYSSAEVMKTKILYAINNCVEMDADFRLAGNEVTGWGGEGVGAAGDPA